MALRCLGSVTIEPARFEEIIVKLRELSDDEDRKRLSSVLTYFQLGEKRYVPLTDEGKVDHSEHRCKITLERSKEKPQPIGEVVESMAVSMELHINHAMLNRLWLYDGKLYQSARNDYAREQVHLLILDFLDREKRRFEDLKQKFKRK